MKKKIIMAVAPILAIAFFLFVIVASLISLDFFGANVTDGYVVDNMQYAQLYKSVTNKYINNGEGYVSLERILYFYLESSNLSFEQIYKDNLDSETKKMKPISSVCTLEKYKILSGCKSGNISSSGQIDDDVRKPFNYPLNIGTGTITSFFMEQRIVFGKNDVHGAWDIGAGAHTPVYSVCDGTVESVSFTQTQNVTNTNAGGGNQIKIRCEVDDVTYHVIYAHLYPNSSKVKNGDPVKHWQQIAEVGTTGYSTGNHLHYQVERDNTKVDGMSLIDFTNKKQ